MNFINAMMLIGLAAVSIPIIIHLLNRRRARVVDWGAMRFLLGSVAARNRRIMIEEIILMILRCLLVALVVLAIARPFVPKDAMIPWSLVLPAFFAAFICIAIAGAAWIYRKLRVTLLLVAAGLLVLAGAASASEYFLQRKIWPADRGGRDVAIVIDGSTSMGLRREGRSNFESAVEEARNVVEACAPSDTISLFVAGSMTRELLPGPTSDRGQIDAALRDIRPAGGSLRVLRAFDQAIGAIQGGHNSVKKIVLLHDGQDVGWELANGDDWKARADQLTAGRSGGARRPQIICRTLPIPEQVANAAIESVKFSHEVIGTGRAVKIDVVVRNYGTMPVSPSHIEMHVEGLTEQPQPENVREIPQNASQIVSFEHRFDQPGPHVLTFRFAGSDDIPNDNAAVRVVDVIDRLPVLVVDGSPSERFESSAAGYLELALSVKEENPDTRGRADEEDEEQVRSIIEPKVIPVTDLAREKDFSQYRAVILANVPLVPTASATELAKYVTEGGGLLIAPGNRAEADFYHEWMNETGRRLCPARLSDAREHSADGVAMSLKSFTHGALLSIIESGESDAEDARVSAWWGLSSFDREKLSVRATLKNGSPLIVERQVGDGTVLMTAMALHADDTNLPRRNFFVPLVHELTYVLAGAGARSLNIRPGMEIALPEATGAAKRAADEVEVVKASIDEAGREADDGLLLPVAVEFDDNGRVAKLAFTATSEPGLYRFRLPAELAGDLADTPAEQKGLPFVVTDDPAESSLATLQEGDMDRLREHLKGEDGEAAVRLDVAANTGELTDMVIGHVPGEEMWKYLAVAALLALVGEIGLTRWIAAQRKAHSAETVTFGHAAEEARSFRARAREMVQVPTEQPQTAGRS